MDIAMARGALAILRGDDFVRRGERIMAIQAEARLAGLQEAGIRGPVAPMAGDAIL